MSITYVQSTTVCVSDQDAALDFYVHKLGFEVREDAPFANDQQTAKAISLTAGAGFAAAFFQSVVEIEI